MRHNHKAGNKVMQSMSRVQIMLAFIAIATLLFLVLVIALKMSLKKAVRKAKEEEATPLQPRGGVHSNAHYANFAGHGANGEEEWIVPDEMPKKEEAEEEDYDPGLIGSSPEEVAQKVDKGEGGIGYDFV
jgi:preprotein translocase subunit SecG